MPTGTVLKNLTRNVSLEEARGAVAARLPGNGKAIRGAKPSRNSIWWPRIGNQQKLYAIAAMLCLMYKILGNSERTRSAIMLTQCRMTLMHMMKSVISSSKCYQLTLQHQDPARMFPCLPAGTAKC